MIAARRTIDQLRKLKKRASPLEESFAKEFSAEPENEITDEKVEKLVDVVAELPPRDRIIIDLCFRQNLSSQDVASILHLSVGAVYTQKSRILAKLRESLEKSRSV